MNRLPIQAERIVTIAVDVQNDFCPGGSLAVAEGDLVVSPLNQVFEYTRQQNGLIIATGDQHPEQTPHFNIWPIHCIAGTEGAALRSDLDIRPTDIIINKGMGQTDGYSGIEGVAIDGQTIEELITPVDNERVVVLIGGLAIDYCVLNTTLDTLKIADIINKKQIHGKISVFAIKNAMKAVNIQPDDGDKAIIAMQQAGAIFVTSDDIIAGRVVELARSI